MGMSLGGGGDSKNPPPEMNVTPLVDVTLVVLIIFMVVTPLMTKTFWINVPKQDEKTQQEPPQNQDPPLVLTIGKDGVVRVNKTELTPDEIVTRLPRMMAAKNQKVLYIDASDDVPFGRVTEVMDLAKQGGARTIAMLTETVIR